MSHRYSGQSDSTQPWAGEETAVPGPRIFLADPDPLTRELIVDFLRGKGFEVFATPDMDTSPPPADVLILTLDGMEPRASRPKWLLEKLEIPTVVLDRSHVFPGRTAALGFTPHARLSLPIQPRKLVATIRQALSLARVESADPREEAARIYRFSGWTLHCHEHRLVSHEGQSTLLDKQEFEVLRTLLTFPRQLLTRQQLITLAWGAGIEVENRTLDRPITRLRRHLGEDARFPRLIRTIVGMGYRLEADVEKIL